MFRFGIRDVLWLTVVVALAVVLASKVIATRGSRLDYLEGYYAGTAEELTAKQDGVLTIQCFFSGAYQDGYEDGRNAIRSVNPAPENQRAQAFIRELRTHPDQ